MPRPPRIDAPNAVHHVMNRGARHQPIFVSDSDRRSFLSLVGEACEKYAISVHAYCLMTNHFHVLAQSEGGLLSEAMRHIAGVHALRFNLHNGTDGPLFRGRFASKIVDTDSYLLQVSRYIHLNPVDAGMVAAPEDHRWSSYPAYIGAAARPRWLDMSMTLTMAKGSGAYRRFVEGGIDPQTRRLYERAETTGVLGSDEFAARLCPGRRVGAMSEGTLRLVDECVASAFGARPESVRVNRRGRRNVARMAAVAMGRSHLNLPYKTLAAHYGFRSDSGAASAVRRFNELCVDDPVLTASFAAARARLATMLDT